MTWRSFFFYFSNTKYKWRPLSKPLRLIPLGFPARNLVHDHGVKRLNGDDEEQLSVGEVRHAG